MGYNRKGYTKNGIRMTACGDFDSPKELYDAVVKRIKDDDKPTRQVMGLEFNAAPNAIGLILQASCNRNYQGARQVRHKYTKQQCIDATGKYDTPKELQNEVDRLNNLGYSITAISRECALPHQLVKDVLSNILNVESNYIKGGSGAAGKFNTRYELRKELDRIMQASINAITIEYFTNIDAIKEILGISSMAVMRSIMHRSIFYPDYMARRSVLLTDEEQAKTDMESTARYYINKSIMRHGEKLVNLGLSVI